MEEHRIDASLADIVFSRAAEGIAVTDARGLVLHVNEAFTRLTGYSEGEVRGQSLRILKSDRQTPEFYAEMWRRLGQTGRWQGEIWNRRKDGEEYPEWLSISQVRDEQGKPTHFVGVFTDIRKMVDEQAELRLLAHHDPQTGLPNRHQFNDRFEQSVRRALRDRRHMAVLFIEINTDGSVHPGAQGAAGNPSLLAEAAQYLHGVCRETDTLARIGDREFVLLVEEIDGPRGVSVTADRLLKALNLPIRSGDDKVFAAASIGISMFPIDGHEAETLIADARTAMHEARLQGRNTYRFYSSEMNAFAGERLMLEGLLRHAFENNELSLKYQPQFDAHTHAVIGVETLLRWSNLVLGMVGPERFVPVAEDNGLIHPIGEWVLRKACAQFVAWQDEGCAPQTLAVNISAKQIAATDFVDMLASVLEDTGMAGECLELELGESLLTEVPYVEQTIVAIRQLKVQISIDDFGTGSSSLRNLDRLPIRKLKIDRSFVRDIGRVPGNETIVRAIIGLARTFDLKVIAEGVETEDQAEFLRREGCGEFQGYLLGRAVRAEDFPAFFQPAATL